MGWRASLIPSVTWVETDGRFDYNAFAGDSDDRRRRCDAEACATGSMLPWSLTKAAHHSLDLVERDGTEGHPQLVVDGMTSGGWVVESGCSGETCNAGPNQEGLASVAAMIGGVGLGGAEEEAGDLVVGGGEALC